jgi:cysteinyl-tRNA synthetase
LASTGKSDIDIQAYEKRFTEAMDDDFNAPIAISVLFDLSREINSALDKEGLSEMSLTEAKAFFDRYAKHVLGIVQESTEEAGSKDVLPLVMDLLLDLRSQARKNKDFALSDQIRDRLSEAGIQIKDGKDGSSWKLG